MTKDELKNRISLALKDPILQQGFEIICKNLSELEKENAELEEKISILLSCKNCPENKGGYICQKEYENKYLAQKIQYIKELKEENAELKEKLNFSTQYYQGEKAKEHLAKAKEIIRELLTCARNYPESNKQKMQKAEQFLKDCEVEK